jgi:hypothetical protein
LNFPVCIGRGPSWWVTYLTRTDDKLLRQVVYHGMRDDKPAADVWQPMPGGGS